MFCSLLCAICTARVRDTYTHISRWFRSATTLQQQWQSEMKITNKTFSTPMPCCAAAGAFGSLCQLLTVSPPGAFSRHLDRKSHAIPFCTSTSLPQWKSLTKQFRLPAMPMRRRSWCVLLAVNYSVLKVSYPGAFRRNLDWVAKLKPLSHALPFCLHYFTARIV
jgi:hypothetical protein